MAARTRLTERDSAIIRVLTHRVRVLSAAQIARVWWNRSVSPRRAATNRLRQLAAHEWIDLYQGFAHPEIPLAGPLVIWCPGLPDPPFGRIAYRLKSRWKQHGVSTHVCVATAKAAELFAGHGGRRPRQSELTHDIHLSTIYLKLHKADPVLAATWQSEADYAAKASVRDVRIPDATVKFNERLRIVDFGGSYSKKKLQDIHRFWSASETEYEVW